MVTNNKQKWLIGNSNAWELGPRRKYRSTTERGGEREEEEERKKVTAFIVRWGLWRGWKGERMERERGPNLDDQVYGQSFSVVVVVRMGRPPDHVQG